MERGSGKAVMRLGPLAQRLLARRRRWLRWAAIALAALTILCAAAQLHRRPAPRGTGTTAGNVPTQAPAPRVYGVAGVVPPGMRAVNLILPAAATFGARLAPGSRVDLLAAFDAGQDRAVRRVLASGIVLHVAPQSATGPTGVPSVAPSADGRFGTAGVAELALAVPEAREREIALAQAFGRMFVAVEPAGPGVSSAAPPPPDDALSLRHYLGFPSGAPATAVPAAFARGSGGLPALPAVPAVPWSLGESARPAMPADPGAHRDAVTVEVIEGTTRTVVEVRP